MNQCWNCDFYQPKEPGTSNAGWCRRYPPRGIDLKSITEPVNPFDVFPPIDDGTAEDCGDFKRNSGEIPQAV